jgi:hypothetical protein
MNRGIFVSVALVAALAAVLSTAAQAGTEPTEITPLVYEPASTDVQAQRQAGACTINIMHIADARPMKESIGVDTAIPSGPTEPWLSASFDSLKLYGFTLTHADTPQPQAVNLDVALIRAYSWFGPMRINGMVAVDVALNSPQGVLKEKFRATGSKTNMWNAKTEHVTALNYALNAMIFNMAPVLKHHCELAKL